MRKVKTAQKLTLSHEEHVAAIAKVNPDIEVLGRITIAREKVLCRCKVCNYKWMITPESLKRGKGCPRCARLKVTQSNTLTREEHVAAIVKVNPSIEVLGEITGSDKKALCRCKVCDYKWLSTPSRLKCGHGCPKCAKHGFLSHEYGKLYIMVDDLEVPTVMKVGVSVKENKRRNQV
ncbi:hypothetical protein ACLB1T_02800 [Escherichia coli]